MSNDRVDSEILRTEVLVIGSGAGGAVSAATLAERGHDVLLVEEGSALDTGNIATASPHAIAQLYRDGGLTPIMGTPNIAYVEGCCLGGSTEVNSAFWHRTPADCYRRWGEHVDGFCEGHLDPYFEMLESTLSVSSFGETEPPQSSRVFRRGIERMKWRYSEVPRCQRGDPGLSAFDPAHKQSMQRTYLPKAIGAGARLLSESRAVDLVHDSGRVNHVLIEQRGAGSLRVRADEVFVCAGAVQSAVLLRRSGIKKNIGNNLCIHPMLKVAAVFDQIVDAHVGALPVYQVKEMWPDIALGGSVFSPGFLAMHLSENWLATQDVMREWRRTALYYTATRGKNRGRIRVAPGPQASALVRYSLSPEDCANLSRGLAYLGEALFAAGAKAVYPSLRSVPRLSSVEDCRRFHRQPAAAAAMSLSTVHAFSSCPMGRDSTRSATDSFGKVHGFENLYINDASLLPDSPGVNPQGTIMAIALRNIDHFCEKRDRCSTPSSRRAHE